MVPYSGPIQDHKFRLLFTMKPSYLWTLMIQKFSCKYCVHKYLNLSHFFPLRFCSSFSILLVEELLMSESNRVALHMEINWPRLFSASSVRHAVSAEVSRILNSASCHAPITTSRAQGSYCSHAPCLALLLAWVGTKESGSIFRDEDPKRSSLSPSVSPPLLLFLSIYLFLSSCCLLTVTCTVI